MSSPIKEQKEALFRVGFILLDEFTLFALSGFVDVLRLAGNQSDDSEQKDYLWTIVAPTMAPVRSNSGIEILPWETFSAETRFDYLVVVGGRVEPQRKTDIKTADYIRKFAGNGGFVIGLCTASFVLARIGVLDHRKTCVHWHHRAEFETEFPEIQASSDRIFIEDRGRITCPGGRSASDVALHLIEKHCGPSKARKAASGLMIEEIRSGQSPQPNVGASWFKDIPHPLVRRAVIIMDQSISSELPMKELAVRLGVGQNTMFRLFQQQVATSPAKIMRILRLAHARWSLFNTEHSISQIAHKFLFSDASHFSKMHRQYYGNTPTEARLSGSAGSTVHKGIRETIVPILSHILDGELFLLDDRY